jgi:hypothetical protein
LLFEQELQATAFTKRDEGMHSRGRSGGLRRRRDGGIRAAVMVGATPSSRRLRVGTKSFEAALLALTSAARSRRRGRWG